MDLHSKLEQHFNGDPVDVHRRPAGVVFGIEVEGEGTIAVEATAQEAGFRLVGDALGRVEITDTCDRSDAFDESIRLFFELRREADAQEEAKDILKSMTKKHYPIGRYRASGYELKYQGSYLALWKNHVSGVWEASFDGSSHSDPNPLIAIAGTLSEGVQ